jgi:hypothetical protein
MAACQPSIGQKNQNLIKQQDTFPFSFIDYYLPEIKVKNIRQIPMAVKQCETKHREGGLLAFGWKVFQD